MLGGGNFWGFDNICGVWVLKENFTLFVPSPLFLGGFFSDDDDPSPPSPSPPPPPPKKIYLICVLFFLCATICTH